MTKLFALFVVLGASLVRATNPGFGIEILGIHVDTYDLIHKLEKALADFQQGTYGRLIHFREYPSCLDAGVLAYATGYLPSPNRLCNAMAPTQQWRLITTRLDVASGQYFPLINQGLPSGVDFTPCLDCHTGDDKCDIIVNQCLKNDGTDEWMLRVHPSQVSLGENRIYFAIHNKKHDGHCLSKWNRTTGGEEQEGDTTPVTTPIVDDEGTEATTTPTDDTTVDTPWLPVEVGPWGPLPEPVHHTTSTKKPTTHYVNNQHNHEMFRLADCAGNEEQSFYIDADFSKEIAEIKRLLLEKGITAEEIEQL